MAGSSSAGDWALYREQIAEAQRQQAWLAKEDRLQLAEQRRGMAETSHAVSETSDKLESIGVPTTIRGLGALLSGRGRDVSKVSDPCQITTDIRGGKHTLLNSFVTQRNLAVMPTGNVTGHGQMGPYARFVIQSAKDASILSSESDDGVLKVTIQNVFSGKYLSLGSSGRIGMIDSSDSSLCSSDSSKNPCILAVDVHFAEDGALFVCFQSLSSMRYLSVNERGMGVSVNKPDRGVWFSLLSCLAKSFDHIRAHTESAKARIADEINSGSITHPLSKTALVTSSSAADTPGGGSSSSYSSYSSTSISSSTMKQPPKSTMTGASGGRGLMGLLRGVASSLASSSLSSPLSSSSMVHSRRMPFPGRSMSKEEKKFFKDYGFILIKKAIPELVIQRALKYINLGVSQGDHIKDGGKFGGWKCKEQVILDLYWQSHAHSLVNSLMKKTDEDSGTKSTTTTMLVPGAQIALRFPRLGDPPMDPGISKRPYSGHGLKGDQWHIDGMRSHNEIGICRFSVLCGFVLSPWKVPFQGNFVLWPKTHTRVFELIQHCGGVEGFMERVRMSPKQTPCVFSEIDDPARWVIAEPGDMVLCHPMLAHRAGPNFSHAVRYAVFMRPTRFDHLEYLGRILESDIWAEYDV